MAETALGTGALQRRVSISPVAGWLFVLCCAVSIAASSFLWVMDNLHFPSSITEFVSGYVGTWVEEVGLVIAGYRVWLESKKQDAAPRLLPARPAGVRLFAIFQGTVAAIVFLLIPVGAILSSADTPSPHVVTVWWEQSATIYGVAFGCIAAFLGYYAWGGSKGARDAVLILSAAQVLGLVMWYALWLIGVIPRESGDDGLFSQITWLPYVWGLVNIWYFGFSRARTFYAA